MNLTPRQAENCTRVLIKMHTDDLDREHPVMCNCERCDYRLTVALRDALKLVGGAI